MEEVSRQDELGYTFTTLAIRTKMHELAEDAQEVFTRMGFDKTMLQPTEESIHFP